MVSPSAFHKSKIADAKLNLIGKIIQSWIQAQNVLQTENQM